MYDYAMGKFGDLLKLYRLADGMTQKELAAKMGVSFQSVSSLAFFYFLTPN